MGGPVMVLALGLVLADKPAPVPASAADVITLRDGRVVLGWVRDAPGRSGLPVIIRRAWAKRALPDLAKRWETEESAGLRRAVAQRRERLEAWRRDRGRDPGPDDRISAWIAKELGRLEGAEPPRAPLLMVIVGRGNIRAMTRRPAGTARLLHLAWRLGFDDAESLPVDRLKDALEGRGFTTDGGEPVSIEHLLPIPQESDARWLARRAATEVLHDPGLRFLRIEDFVMAEPAPGQAADGASALAALGDLKRLLDDNPGDPVARKLDEVTKRGRVGAVVTRQVTSPDLSGATVEVALHVRGLGNRWVPLGSRSATVRTAEVRPGEAENLAQDPQLATVFKGLAALGLGDIPADVKQRSLGIGVAVQKALGRARAAFQDDLAALAFPIEAIAPGGDEGAKKPGVP